MEDKKRVRYENDPKINYSDKDENSLKDAQDGINGSWTSYTELKGSAYKKRLDELNWSYDSLTFSDTFIKRRKDSIRKKGMNKTKKK